MTPGTHWGLGAYSSQIRADSSSMLREGWDILFAFNFFAYYGITSLKYCPIPSVCSLNICWMNIRFISLLSQLVVVHSEKKKCKQSFMCAHHNL